METIRLRPLRESDSEALFRIMADPRSREQAAFVHADGTDRREFDRWWRRIVDSPRVRDRAIVTIGEGDDGLLGTIAAFDIEGDREVTYWVVESWRGKGVASAALTLLLEEESERPLFARVAADNAASRRVLGRVGFLLIDVERSYAPGRNAEIDECVFRLD